MSAGTRHDMGEPKSMRTAKPSARAFINMLAHPEESLSGGRPCAERPSQGVTLEVMGEDTMGPLTPP